MPKIYYKCINCGTTKHLKDEVIVTDMSYKYCPYCEEVTGIYKCLYNYWWELLYMKIKNYIRLFINILKILRDSWREFLASVRYYNKLERIIRKWSKK